MSANDGGVTRLKDRKDRKSTKNYVYSIEMVGMTVVLLTVATLAFLPILMFNREIIIAASISPFFILAIAAWFVLHELVHGLSYRMSKGVTNLDISFGAKLEKLVLFCVCKRPISKADTIRSLLAPLIILGILTFIIGIAFNFELLIVLSLINICGASGDILMTIFIAKMPKDMHYFEDEQNRFVLVTEKDVSKKKSPGVKLEEIIDSFEDAPIGSKRVAISKASYLIFGAICLYTALAYFGVLSFI